MHIALATLEYPTESYRAGGMCWAFSKIARGLKEQGHKVTVVVPSESDGSIRDDYGIAVRRYQIKSHLPASIEKALSWRFPIGVNYYNQAWSLYKSLDSIEKETRIDLVLAAATPVSFFAAGSRRWRYVMRISSYRMLIVISNLFPVTAGYMFENWMNIKACASADLRFAPSRMLASIFEQLQCGNTAIIHTPLEKMEAPVSSIELPTRFLLFYGSLLGTKGAHILADALPDILGKYPELHVVFIGRDQAPPEFGSMREYIENKLRGYAPRVHILGVLEQSDAMAYVARAEWALFPSVMDNLPNALLEAMCLSRPVLVSRNSGTDDLVEDGKNGLVVDPNNVEALKAGLVRALSLDETERKRMGAMARETVLRVCDPVIAAKELDALLVSVMKSKTKTASWFEVAVRLNWLRLNWAFKVIRCYKKGAPIKEIKQLESLCARYLPGYKVTVS